MSQPDPANDFEVAPDVIESIEMFLESDTVHPVDCLALAHDLIRQAHLRLNRTESACEHCKLRHFEDYAQAKTAERTKGMLRKLRDLITSNPWDRPTTSTDDPRAPKVAHRSEQNGKSTKRA